MRWKKIRETKNTVAYENDGKYITMVKRFDGKHHGIKPYFVSKHSQKRIYAQKGFNNKTKAKKWISNLKKR